MHSIVLTVYRQQGGTALADRLHEQAASTHQRLLVGEQNRFSRSGGTQRRTQPRKTHDPSDNSINSGFSHQII